MRIKNLFVVEQIKTGLKEEIETVAPYIIEVLKYSIIDKIEKLKKGQDKPTKEDFILMYNIVNKNYPYKTHTNWGAYDIHYRLSSSFTTAVFKIHNLQQNLNKTYKFGWAYEANEAMDAIFNHIITTNKLDQYETYY